VEEGNIKENLERLRVQIPKKSQLGREKSKLESATSFLMCRGDH